MPDYLKSARIGLFKCVWRRIVAFWHSIDQYTKKSCINLPDLPEPVGLDEDELERRKKKPYEIVERIERLDKGLQSLGIRPIQTIWRD